MKIFLEKDLSVDLFPKNILSVSQLRDLSRFERVLKDVQKKGGTLGILDEKSSVRIYVDPKDKHVSVFLGREDRKSSGVEWFRALQIAGEMAKHDEEIAFAIEDRLKELRDPSCIYNLLDEMGEYGRRVVEKEKEMSVFDIVEKGYEKKSIPLASSQTFLLLYTPLYFLNEKYSFLFDVLEEKGFDVGFDERSVSIRKDGVEVKVLGLGNSSLIQSNNPSEARKLLEDMQKTVFEEMVEGPEEIKSYLNGLFNGLEFVSYNLEKGRYTVKMPELALPVKVDGKDYLVRIDEDDKKMFAEKLSEQMKFVYEKSREIGDEKLFKEFCDELKALYPEIFPLAFNMTKQDSEDVKKFLNNYGKADLKKVLIAAGIAGMLGAAVYFLSQDRQPPTIKLEDQHQSEGKLFLKANIQDPSGVSGAYALIKYPSGNVYNATFSKMNDHYVAQFPITEEGVYSIQIFAKDAKGNLGSITTSFAFFDNPVISDINYLYVPNTLNFNVTANDLSGISKVLLEILNKNYTLSPLQVDLKGNGVYGGKIPLSVISADKISYRVFAFDKLNKATIVPGHITLTPKQAFLAWVKSKGYDLTLASKLFDKVSLVQDLFAKGKLNTLENVLKVAYLNGSDVPKNLAYIVLDQIIRDYRVKDKAGAINKIFNTYVEFGLKDLTIDQIYHANNASLIMGADRSILDALKAIKKYGVKLGEIAEDVVDEVANVHANLARLFKYNVTIRDEDVQVIAGRYSKFYPEFKDWKNLMGLILKKSAEQIQRLLYDTFEGGKKDKLAKPETRGNYDYWWKNYVKPCLELSIYFLKEGDATEWGNPYKLEYQLLPPSILKLDMKTGKVFSRSLEIGRRNVNYDPELGTSPALWWFENYKKDVIEGKKVRSLAYRISHNNIFFGPGKNWPNSFIAYQGGSELQQGLWIYPRGGILKVIYNTTDCVVPIDRGYVTWFIDKRSPLPFVSEANRGLAAAVVDWIKGMPATEIGARYPGGDDFHDHVIRFVNHYLQKKIVDFGLEHGYGQPIKIDGVVAFHPWLYEKPLFKDYARKNDKPHVIYLHSSGKWKKVEGLEG